ncbi:MAG: hypothetical protein ACTSXT_04740 [Candidatus Helarchaeota archaeon]
MENKVIDGGGLNNGITISYTNAYFIIRKCKIYNSQYGTVLNHVVNGRIMNNTIYNNSYSSIFLYNGNKNNFVLKNILYDQIIFSVC